SWVFVLACLAALTALLGGIYIFNQIADRKTDKANGKLFLLANGFVSAGAAVLEASLLSAAGTAGAAALFIAPQRRRWGAGMAAGLSLLFGIIHVEAQLPYGGDEFSTVAPRQIAALLRRAEENAKGAGGPSEKTIGYYDHADFEATLDFLFPDWTFVNFLDDPRARRLWPDRPSPASAPSAEEPHFWLLSKFRRAAEPSEALGHRLARSRIVEETQGFQLLQGK
ncbi:MAG: hypothetical protein NTW86_13440, partial [Candidatus Sumerlaeota bacterium]|nr:hypothetical protein [Candidatus Sumerlaeota bacterium]